jgi:hypothetical protein
VYRLSEVFLLGGKGLSENNYIGRVWAMGDIQMPDYKLGSMFIYWEVLKINDRLSLNIETQVQYLNVSNQKSATAIFWLGLNLSYPQMFSL